MDREAWQAIVCGVAKSHTPLKQLSMHLMIALMLLNYIIPNNWSMFSVSS